MRAPWSKEGARGQRFPQQHFLGQPGMPCGHSWWGGLAHRIRAAGGKGLHGTSFPLWDSSPGHPVGSM